MTIEPEPAGADEDTLSGLEGVPAVETQDGSGVSDTATVSDTDREPAPKRRRRWPAVLLLVLLALLLAGAALLYWQLYL